MSGPTLTPGAAAHPTSRRSSRPVRRPLVGLGLVALVTAVTPATASSAQAVPAGAAAKPAGITWGACPTVEDGSTRNPKQQCGTLQVPLDYRHPRGRTITIAVSRIPASAPGEHRGALLVNPGGPGGPGLDMPSGLAGKLPAAVLDSYDLIGFDPRGVGHSTPISCGLSLKDLNDSRWEPDRKGSIAASVGFLRSVADRCWARSGALLPYITTANTARDMDRIREALGVQRISYFGVSYGTYLGAVYSSLFNARTDRVVLDSSVDPHGVWRDMLLIQDRGVARRFPDVLKYMVAHPTAAGFGATAAKVRATYLALVDRLDRKPVRLPAAGFDLNAYVLRTLTANLSYNDDYLPVLAATWRSAAALAAGTGSETDRAVIARLVAVFNAVSPGVPADNMAAVFNAVTCDDVSWPKNLARYSKDVVADRAAYPVTGGMSAAPTPCVFWHGKPIEPVVSITGRGQRNILLLQNRRDPSTPWESGLGMRASLGRRAAFVGVNAGGHGVTGKGSCADGVTATFLTTGRLPGKDVLCTK